MFVTFVNKIVFKKESIMLKIKWGWNEKVAAAAAVTVVLALMAFNNYIPWSALAAILLSILKVFTIIAVVTGAVLLVMWWKQKESKPAAKPKPTPDSTPTTTKSKKCESKKPKWLMPVAFCVGLVLVVMLVNAFNGCSNTTPRSTVVYVQREGGYITPRTELSHQTANPLLRTTAPVAPSLVVYGDRAIDIPTAYNNMLIQRSDPEAIFVLHGFNSGGQEVGPPWISRQTGGTEHFPNAYRYTIQCTNRAQTIVNFVPDH